MWAFVFGGFFFFMSSMKRHSPGEKKPGLGVVVTHQKSITLFFFAC